MGERGLHRSLEPSREVLRTLGLLEGGIVDIIANNNIDQKVVEISSLQHYALVENSIDHSIFLLKAYTMMFSYHQVKERPKLLLAMPGLNHAEFAQ